MSTRPGSYCSFSWTHRLTHRSIRNERMIYPITEHVTKADGHTTFYLACGAKDAPLIIFVHGWPELSISWRHQLPAFAALGFRAIAPDMRGYGRSTIHPRHE